MSILGATVVPRESLTVEGLLSEISPPELAPSSEGALRNNVVTELILSRSFPGQKT